MADACDATIQKRASELMKQVYDDGFNIYQCLNRLKKNMKKTDNFPPEVIIWTCESYFNTDVKKDFPWFLTVFKQNSMRWFAELHEKESEQRHSERGKVKIPQSMKAIMKGMFE